MSVIKETVVCLAKVADGYVAATMDVEVRPDGIVLYTFDTPRKPIAGAKTYKAKGTARKKIPELAKTMGMHFVL